MWLLRIREGGFLCACDVALWCVALFGLWCTSSKQILLVSTRRGVPAEPLVLLVLCCPVVLLGVLAALLAHGIACLCTPHTAFDRSGSHKTYIRKKRCAMIGAGWLTKDACKGASYSWLVMASMKNLHLSS
jgi:hypothetical protein